MKFRSLILFALIVLGLTHIAFAQKAAPNGAANGLRLAKQLPESDGILLLDVKRLFSDALPQILSGNQPMLDEVINHADRIKTLTGIDIRQFDRVAIGTTIKSVSAKEVDMSPVVLAEGKYTAESLLAAVKLASNASYREEKAGGKTLYIFTPRPENLPAGAVPKPSNSFIGNMIERAMKGIVSHEIAVSPLNATTVAFGPVSRVKLTAEGVSRAGLTVLSLPGLQRGAVGSFGAKLPSGLSGLLGYDLDEVGKSINTVRYLSGWMDVEAGSTVVRTIAKTTLASDAEDLFLTLQDLQAIGKSLLGGTKGADKQVYRRLIDSLKFTRTGNELTIDLQVPQTDINILIGEKK
jgi:hypothetical protein